VTQGEEAPERGFAKLRDAAAIAYEVHGREHTGTPVLLIRPLGGSMTLWGEFRARLASRVRVIAFDFRGTGRSSADPPWVSTKGLARDGVGVLDHLGVGRAHVFGISLGGMAATWLAIRAPSRVATLCIASAPARGIAVTRAGLRRELAMAACFVRPRDEVEAGLVDRIFSVRFREDHPDQVRRLEQTLHANPTSRVALLKHALAGLLHDASRELHRIEAPSLVLAGDDDLLLGKEPVRALSRGIPRARFETIASAGHDLTLEQPRATATRVADFLRS
jgi:pimeloyl-ACP methyl ester carboxylesterase